MSGLFEGMDRIVKDFRKNSPDESIEREHSDFLGEDYCKCKKCKLLREERRKEASK